MGCVSTAGNNAQELGVQGVEGDSNSITEKQVGVEQVEGSPIGAGQKERQEEEEETPDYPQVRRSLQGQHTPHLSLGAREGGDREQWGERHTCPLGNSPLEE
ncbi:2-isopropylmalate synthase [Dissostichus eleginoides]|uniref:2-isopropylmalate synthase n=1 Tax=Dissostichus eleginoides TaxID=100907 RepID=A0AAD9CFW6_DISEL|nr:2-isopropylmalate synthase [Dissostichus eleginoides]